MNLKRLALAATSAAAVLACSQAQASQIWYTTTGVSNVFITGLPNIAGFYIPNVSLKFSVVGDTTNYVDDPMGVRLIPADAPSAFVSATGTGVVVPYPGACLSGNCLPRPVSFTDFKLSLEPDPPGEHTVFADGFGDFDGKYAYGDVSGSLVDLGDTFGGAGLAGWDGVSALATTPVALLEGDDPGFDTSAGTTWHLLNLHDMTFTATLAGGSPDTPLVVIGGDPSSTSYTFDFSATGGVPVYIDPVVATGYDYVLGPDSPLIASAVFPVIGSSLYSIYALGDLVTPLFTNIVGGQFVDFTSLYPGGINGFALRGVDANAGLDPADDTAFVTGLTFVGDGKVNLTQTAITTYVAVPEPSTWALMLTGFLSLGGLLRRKPRSGAVAAA